MSIAGLEKGREIGSHALSGAVVDPRAFRELYPDDWKSAPFEARVEHEELLLLTQKSSRSLPIPPPLDNEGNYAVRLTASTTLRTDTARRLRAVPDGAGRALVTVRVFVDLDADGRWSAGDKPLRGVNIARVGITTHDGRATAWLPAWSTLAIKLGEEELDDPRHFPPTRALTLVVRPGRVTTVDVPVQFRDADERTTPSTQG